MAQPCVETGQACLTQASIGNGPCCSGNRMQWNAVHQAGLAWRKPAHTSGRSQVAKASACHNCVVKQLRLATASRHWHSSAPNGANGPCMAGVVHAKGSSCRTSGRHWPSLGCPTHRWCLKTGGSSRQWSFFTPSPLHLFLDGIRCYVVMREGPQGEGPEAGPALITDRSGRPTCVTSIFFQFIYTPSHPHR